MFDLYPREACPLLKENGGGVEGNEGDGDGAGKECREGGEKEEKKKRKRRKRRRKTLSKYKVCSQTQGDKVGP